MSLLKAGVSSYKQVTSSNHVEFNTLLISTAASTHFAIERNRDGNVISITTNKRGQRSHSSKYMDYIFFLKKISV